jgi:hypothetical protein
MVHSATWTKEVRIKNIILAKELMFGLRIED